MKAALSLTIMATAIALAVTAPTAFGEGRLAGSPTNDAVAYFHANELSTAATSSLPVSEAVSYFRANELATAATAASSMPTYRDAHERAEPVSSGPTEDVSATSGSDSSIDWYLVAVAIGIGVALAFGLLLTVRLWSSKPVAQ